jgi:hypothetical protein
MAKPPIFKFSNGTIESVDGNIANIDKVLRQRLEINGYLLPPDGRPSSTKISEAVSSQSSVEAIK